jgi:cobalt/nickel transport protein
MATKRPRRNNGLLIALLLAVLVLTAAPLALHSGSEFNGTDEQAQKAIEDAHPDVKPWFTSIVTWPGGEVQTLLFSVEAALGAGAIGYYFGLKRGEGGAREKMEHESPGNGDPDQ